jgi:hypothetical protein
MKPREDRAESKRAVIKGSARTVEQKTVRGVLLLIPGQGSPLAPTAEVILSSLLL